MVQDSTSAEYVVHLFSGLVSLNSDLEVIPDLADHWEISGDGRTYTFHLLPGATFQDGKPITAEDFVYALTRACSPELGSPVALSYLSDIVGASDYGAGRADHISGVKALSGHVLEIEIDAPKVYFMAKLTYPTAFVVDREQVEREGSAWSRAPNGSGPNLSGGLPITRYDNDRLDIVGIGAAEIERISDPANPLHVEHHTASELSVQYLGLNVNRPPFDDIRVRQAFAHAIDAHKIADLVRKGTALAAKGVLPPAMPDYDEGLEGNRYDPERARELLAGSRYANQEIVLAVSGTSGHMPPVARAVLSMLEENLGIEVRVEQVDWPHFLQDLNDQRYQMFSIGWVADYPDSQNFLDLLFHSQSSQNHTGYANAEVDRLLEQARVEMDPAKRTTLYRQAEHIVVGEAPWIPLTHGVTHTLVKPYVKGYHASASLYPWLKDIYLER
jgi:ABC-type transport system substrate-binding protein